MIIRTVIDHQECSCQSQGLVASTSSYTKGNAFHAGVQQPHRRTGLRAPAARTGRHRCRSHCRLAQDRPPWSSCWSSPAGRSSRALSRSSPASAAAKRRAPAPCRSRWPGVGGVRRRALRRPTMGAISLALLFGLFNLIAGSSSLMSGFDLRRTGATLHSVVAPREEGRSLSRSSALEVSPAGASQAPARDQSSYRCSVASNQE